MGDEKLMGEQDVRRLVAMNSRLQAKLERMERKVIGSPACRVYRSTNQTITTGTDTAVLFTDERYDPSSMHSTSSNTSRLTCVMAGVHIISGHINFDINATGWRSIMIRLNGTTVIGEDREMAATGIEQRIALTTQYLLAVGDYVEVVVRQSSGGDLALVTQSNYGIEAAMARM